MKAQLVDDPFDNERWLFEVKWDGIRLISFIDNGDVSLRLAPAASSTPSIHSSRRSAGWSRRSRRCSMGDDASRW